MATKKITWYLIADAAAADIYVNEGPGKGLHPEGGRHFKVDLPAHTRDMVTDQQGRSSAPGRGERFSVGAGADPREHLEAEFLRHVAAAVGKAAEKKRFDRLVVVAGPKALGLLRSHLPDAARQRITGELDKDLVQLSPEAIEDHLVKADLLV